jgi:hypothetical protein
MSYKKESEGLQRDVIEFLTVAVEYCLFVEHASERSREEFVSTSLKLLPLLYLKGELLPETGDLYDDCPYDYVSEENYDVVRHNIAYVMGSADDFLDVFVEDMRYSDQPVLCTVSELMADIYQDLKNFVVAYRDGTDSVREGAVSLCRDNFIHYWGQRLLNVMRPLHDLLYNTDSTDD